MTYDADRKRVILFGGFDAEADHLLGDHWEYDGEWVEMTPLSLPPPRDGHAMAYDPERRRIVLFGGLAWNGLLSSRVQDTWEYYRP
jgi:hypothetical protein